MLHILTFCSCNETTRWWKFITVSVTVWSSSIPSDAFWRESIDASKSKICPVGVYWINYGNRRWQTTHFIWFDKSYFDLFRRDGDGCNARASYLFIYLVFVITCFGLCCTSSFHSHQFVRLLFSIHLQLSLHIGSFENVLKMHRGAHVSVCACARPE